MDNDDEPFDAEAAKHLAPARHALREAARRALHYTHQRTTPNRQAMRQDIDGLLLEIDEALESGVSRARIAQIIARTLGHNRRELDTVLSRELAKTDGPVSAALARQQPGGGEKKPASEAAAAKPPGPRAERAPAAKPVALPPQAPPAVKTGADPTRIELTHAHPPVLTPDQVEALDPTGEVRAAIEKNPAMEAADIGWLADYKSKGSSGVSDAMNKCMWIIRRKMEADRNRV